MNPSSSFNPRRLIVAAVLALIGITAILLWAQGIVREVIVLPLSYLMYTIRIFTITTPEWYFWAVVLLISVLMAYRSLARKRTVYAPIPTEFNELGYAPTASGRVLFWAQKVQLMRKGASRYYTTNFHATYGRLLVNVLSHRYRISQREVEDRLRNGTIDVPDHVRDYALFALQRDEVQAMAFFPWLWRSIVERLREMFPNRQPDVTSPAGDDPRLAAILQYIEDELEVSHDNTGR